MKRLLSILASLALVFTLAASASAALYLRGQGEIISSGSFGYALDINRDPIETYDATGMKFNLVYDDVLNITWLDFTNKDDEWWDQMSWAENLVINFGGKILSNWRLPITDERKANFAGGHGYSGPYDEDGNHDYLYGYNMVNSEMGHLFYLSLGFKGYEDKNGNNQPGYGVQDNPYFHNFFNSGNWSGTEYSRNTDRAWRFYFHGGGQYYLKDKDSLYQAVAVMDGDVGNVPIPAAVWLLGSGFLGLVGLRRKYRGGQA